MIVSVRVKAFYMYEAGRISSHFGDCDSAIRFYHLASDALFTKQKHLLHSAEVDRQTRMLCAAANDVGYVEHKTLITFSLFKVC